MAGLVTVKAGLFLMSEPQAKTTPPEPPGPTEAKVGTKVVQLLVANIGGIAGNVCVNRTLTA